MASSKENHPEIEGIIPHTNATSVAGVNVPPPIGVAPQGTYVNQQANYVPPPGPGNIGQPPAPYGGYGPQGIFGPPPTHGPPPTGYQGGPVINQPAPGAHGWMNMPQNVPNCPPGLEYLTQIDQLLVHQEIDILEVISKYEMENKFTIFNGIGQKIYTAIESSDACMRNCCGSFRPFEIKILDNFGKAIIQLNRPFACQGCCCPCFLQKMEVFSPPGNLVGTVEQEWSLWVPRFAIKNATGDVVLRIAGPYCTMACCGGDVVFQVLTSDGGNQVGKISKKWAGYAQENLTDADNFGINFPMDLDVKMKAVMLGACFLIDMMYYERRGKHNQTRNRNTTTNGTATTPLNRT